MIYSVEIPLPPKPCSSNWRGHWCRRAKAVKGYREACYVRYHHAQLTGKLPIKIESAVTIHADFYLCNRSPVEGMTYGQYAGVVMPRDADNARGCLKPAQDALVDVGIIRKDSFRFVYVGKTHLHTRAKEHQGRSCVVLTLEVGA